MAQTSHLDNLPSNKNFYSKFEQSRTSTGSCGNGYENNIKGSLVILGDGTDYENRFKSACCTASEMGSKEQPIKRERYNFLYYWIGGEVLKKLKKNDNDATFKAFMSSICPNIINEHEGDGYKVICESIDGSIFQHRKTIFNYYHDYKDVKSGVQGDKSNCKDKWLSYLEGIVAACDAVSKDCQDIKSNNKLYCTNFSSRYGAYCDMVKVLKEECESQAINEVEKACLCTDEKSQTEKLSKQLSESEQAVSKATTTASITSILGTLAVTAFPFLLYKYKPWSSWFGNRSSGNGVGRSNRRKRGSAGLNFDVSAEETFTEYSTDNSTIGDSTTDNSTTLRSPTAYTRQPNRGEGRKRATGTGGAPGLPKIGYQTM
ncbi:KIR-like protein [Plasmodium coatneyi]|uniref:KIR-like protein n=1 Tax=Plasmodium coatneyi TaxID=208452 RepID=A0A1B1DX87_9APIC|nr:KIR-like protein [Plasmodium coatneyi]ANQ07205.1 KIR-like protein [Plasmodium coatneyi]